MKIATIQVGELGFGGGVGDWYVYPENISTKELKVEVEDLFPFYDWVLRPVALPEHIDAEKVFEKFAEKELVLYRLN